jgi:RNA polymerase-binding transcription factor DksA
MNTGNLDPWAKAIPGLNDVDRAGESWIGGKMKNRERNAKRDAQQRRPLSGEELEGVRENLVSRKEELWQEILTDLEEDARDEHIIQTIKDEGDAALEELRESTVFSLVRLKYEELRSIEQALARINQGKYGRCQDCSRWIRPARLEIMPSAVRCRRCQDKRERRYRSTSTSKTGYALDYE